MTTTFNTQSIIVRFHIGRGGHFHNSGYKTFVGEENLQDVIRMMSEQATIISEDENGNQLPESEWTLIYKGVEVLKGEEINAEVGIIEVDGAYDTDICRYIEDCTEDELELIWKAIENDEICVYPSIHEELREAISQLLERPLVTSIKMYPSNAEIHTTTGCISISRDGFEEYDEEEAANYLKEEYSFTQKDAEKIADSMDTYEWFD